MPKTVLERKLNSFSRQRSEVPWRCVQSQDIGTQTAEVRWQPWLVGRRRDARHGKGPQPNEGTSFPRRLTPRIVTAVALALAFVASLGFVSGKAFTAEAASSVPDGTFVQVTGHAPIYRVVGGSPVHLATCAPVGYFPGCSGVRQISQAQLDGMPRAPRDGAFLRKQDGTVFRMAGESPVQLFTCSPAGYFPGCTGIVDLDGIAVDRLIQRRPVPRDGAFLRDPNGTVFRMAGRSPVQLFTCSRTGYFPGCTSIVDIDGIALSRLQAQPAPVDGTFLRDPNGTVFRMAGASPLQIFNCEPLGGCRDVQDLDGIALGRLRDGHHVPKAGTFIRGAESGDVYRSNGSHICYVPSWGPYGGNQPLVEVNSMTIDRLLEATPGSPPGCERGPGRPKPPESAPPPADDPDDPASPDDPDDVIDEYELYDGELLGLDDANLEDHYGARAARATALRRPARSSRGTGRPHVRSSRTTVRDAPSGVVIGNGLRGDRVRAFRVCRAHPRWAYIEVDRPGANGTRLRGWALRENLGLNRNPGAGSCGDAPGDLVGGLNSPLLSLRLVKGTPQSADQAWRRVYHGSGMPLRTRVPACEPYFNYRDGQGLDPWSRTISKIPSIVRNAHWSNWRTRRHVQFRYRTKNDNFDLVSLDSGIRIVRKGRRVPVGVWVFVRRGCVQAPHRQFYPEVRSCRKKDLKKMYDDNKRYNRAQKTWFGPLPETCLPVKAVSGRYTIRRPNGDEENRQPSHGQVGWAERPARYGG